MLDIGCGYGYAAALMTRIAEAVVAVEDDPAIVAEAEARLAGQDVFNVVVAQGPLAEGFASQGPYDAVLIEGAIEDSRGTDRTDRRRRPRHRLFREGIWVVAPGASWTAASTGVRPSTPMPRSYPL